MVRNMGDWGPEVVGLNTEDMEGRSLPVLLPCVGIVSRSADGLDDGVDGRVGGTLNSAPLTRVVVECLCVFAREAAVGSSYRAFTELLLETEPEPDA